MEIKILYSTRMEHDMQKKKILSAFPTDTTGQLQVVWRDGYSLGVDGTQVGVFEEADQVSFAGFLKRQYGRCLETQVCFYVLGDFSNEALEGHLTNQQFRRLLVSTDVTKSDRTGAVATRFFDTASGGRALASRKGGHKFAGRLATHCFASGLLCSGHFWTGRDQTNEFPTNNLRALQALITGVSDCDCESSSSIGWEYNENSNGCSKSDS